MTHHLPSRRDWQTRFEVEDMRCLWDLPPLATPVPGGNGDSRTPAQQSHCSMHGTKMEWGRRQLKAIGRRRIISRPRHNYLELPTTGGNRPTSSLLMMAFTRVRTMMLLLLSNSITICHAIPSPNLKIQTYITHHSGNTDEVLNVPLYRTTVTNAMIASGPNSQSARESNSNMSCFSLGYGLSARDCEYMASIGMFDQGRNAIYNNGKMWIGRDGPNTFTFINGAGVPIILVMWYAFNKDNTSSFMNIRRPEITYSLPETGSAVEISAANGVPGGWSMIYNYSTPLSEYGQIRNTFGEFSTGDYATVDVSRLVNMAGNSVTVRVFGHQPVDTTLQPVCVTDMRTCAYVCTSRSVGSCGATGSYQLVNCGGPNAVEGIDEHGNPTGGCQGWTNGGHIEVIFL
ncbi:hypothetical protein QC761_509790 [Podospora bellae-mahoneyi]|uniref:Uncharacterized protein n=1 Tax=Podospora bellae-mahoneyi TaxID=2093777 RepID=A0ABR0FGI3_9PEZI|nr:hypothetical protein QC761_509790 [Podospora bellae-mahoneyi]